MGTEGVTPRRRSHSIAFLRLGHGRADAAPLAWSITRPPSSRPRLLVTPEPRTERVFERSKRPPLRPLTPLRCVRGSDANLFPDPVRVLSPSPASPAAAPP